MNLELAKMKEMVTQDKEHRVRLVKEQIEHILTTERCTMVPIMVLTNSQVAGRIEIQALD